MSIDCGVNASSFVAWIREICVGANAWHVDMRLVNASRAVRVLRLILVADVVLADKQATGM